VSLTWCCDASLLLPWSWGVGVGTSWTPSCTVVVHVTRSHRLESWAEGQMGKQLSCMQLPKCAELLLRLLEDAVAQAVQCSSSFGCGYCRGKCSQTSLTCSTLNSKGRSDDGC
jgi:hypothetical protein